MKYILPLIFSLLLPACSGDDSSSSDKGHVWQEQTDTIDKAKEVEGIIMDSAEETRKALEQQTQ